MTSAGRAAADAGAADLGRGDPVLLRLHRWPHRAAAALGVVVIPSTAGIRAGAEVPAAVTRRGDPVSGSLPRQDRAWSVPCSSPAAGHEVARPPVPAVCSAPGSHAATRRHDGPLTRSLSVNAIVAAAGVGKGAFFQHFPTRAQYVAELHRIFHEDVTSRVDAASGICHLGSSDSAGG